MSIRFNRVDILGAQDPGSFSEWWWWWELFEGRLREGEWWAGAVKIDNSWESFVKEGREIGSTWRGRRY